jgi:hypothetical protein
MLTILFTDYYWALTLFAIFPLSWPLPALNAIIEEWF